MKYVAKMTAKINAGLKIATQRGYKVLPIAIRHTQKIETTTIAKRKAFTKGSLCAPKSVNKRVSYSLVLASGVLAISWDVKAK